MQRCSYFIPEKALFGSYPSQEEVLYLEDIGVRCFIDLTNSHEEEKTIPYTTNYKYMKYPIPDQNIPEDWKSFAQLIMEICNIISTLPEKEKVYIHCRGGHGRSGVLVACILCYYHGIQSREALYKTNKAHSERPEMRDRWRRIGSPQCRKQKNFVHKFFNELRYDTKEKSPRKAYFISGMNNHSPHPVEIPGVGIFPNAYLAFQYYKCPNNGEYVSDLQRGVYDPSDIILTPDWEEVKVEKMAYVLELKFRQNELIRNILLNTGLRPLVKNSIDAFWGVGKNGNGKNMHGRILSDLRAKLLHEDFLSYKEL